ncbi:MAG: hypothetical protein EZS28_051649, partial [Streblomastix strix]
GKVLLLQQITTSCCLDYSLWRQLLGQSPCIEDLGEEEQITAKSMRDMLSNPEYCNQLSLTFEISIKDEEGIDYFQENSFQDQQVKEDINDQGKSKEKEREFNLEEKQNKKEITINSLVKENIPIVNIPLIPNGHHISVTPQNQDEYIKLYSKRKIFGSEIAQKQRAALFQGFRDAIPFEYLFSDHTLILQKEVRENEDDTNGNPIPAKYQEIVTPTQLTPQELDDIICGKQEIDVKDWEKNTHYDGIDAMQSFQQRKWLWNIINRFTDKQKRDFLQFGTGLRNMGIMQQAESRS